jgi:hypothetical protein
VSNGLSKCKSTRNTISDILNKQCDELKPSCGQCIKGKRVCPGYRDFSELVFRSQNEVVASKVRRREAQNQVKRAAESQHTSSSSSSEGDSPVNDDPTFESELFDFDSPLSDEFSLVSSTSSSPMSSFPLISQNFLTTDLYTSSFNFFFHSFRDQALEQRLGEQDHFVFLFNRSSENNIIRRAIVSVGMAAIANQSQWPEVAAAARKEYTLALRQMNRDLGDPKRRRTEETLAAIPLLGAFEVRKLC